MNTVQMAAKLYECRDTARRLLGEKYAEKMRDWGEVVTACATQEKRDTMSAGIRVASMVDGMDRVMIFAATVELIEPSNAKVSGAGTASAGLLGCAAKVGAGDTPRKESSE